MLGENVGWKVGWNIGRNVGRNVGRTVGRNSGTFENFCIYLPKMRIHLLVGLLGGMLSMAIFMRNSRQMLDIQRTLETVQWRTHINQSLSFFLRNV